MTEPNSYQARAARRLVHPYTHLRRVEEAGPLVIAGGDGVHVIDEYGKRYIEGMSGLWCASLGFSERRLAEAADRQLRTLPFYHQFTMRSHVPGIELAEKLVGLAPEGLEHVFFVNSGSEANDTQIKIVRYYHEAIGKPEKRKIISRERAYHGVTLAAAELTGMAYVHNGFQLAFNEVRRTGAPHFYRDARDGEDEAAFVARRAAELEALILAEGPETVGAFIAEPVQGAGGVIVPPPGYFEAIQAVLKKHDVLFIADEVITGFGRTGNYWGSDTYGIRPDLLSCAKALSAAYLPIGAVLMNDAIYQVLADRSAGFGSFGHGYTYSGHPACAAVALETLRIYEERDIVARVRAMAQHFAEGVERLGHNPLVGDARSVGLIGAVELMADGPARAPFEPALGVGPRVVAAAQEEGLILRAIGDVVAFCPPLVIEEGELAALFERAGRALDRVADELGRAGGVRAA